MLKYKNEEMTRAQWVVEYPLQIIITLDSVFWTQRTEDEYLGADAEGDLDDWYEANVALLDELT